MINKIFFWKKIGAGIIILISVLVIVTLFSSSARANSSDEIELNFSFSEPVITQWNVSNVTYHNVTMNETDAIDIVGVPMLPMKQLYILLPQKGIVKSINITHSNNISLGNGYNVTPGGLLTNQSEIQQNPYNETLFNSSIPYPTLLFKDIGIGYFRGYAILMCHLFPVHYINDTGEIYYYEQMNLTITTNNTGSVSRFFRGLEQDEILMKQLVDDHSMNYTYNSTLELPDDSTIVKQNEQYDFVIITKEDFVNASRPWWWVWEWKTFKDLAKYKNDTLGIKTKIVTIEEILSEPAYYGSNDTWGDGDFEIFNDTQCRIRNFIKHAYITWKTNYILLGGDNNSKNGEELIPARILWIKNPRSNPVYLEIPSDLYYGCLNGSFNADKDNKWGEPLDGNESGDFENPPNRYNYEDENGEKNDYYAEADIQQYKTDFEVGLFTPSFDIGDSESITIKLESNYHSSQQSYEIEFAKIRVWSNVSGTFVKEGEIHISFKSHEITIIDNITINHNKAEVYVEFYYRNSFPLPHPSDISWNIDNILINEKDDPKNIFIFEDFEDPWVENGAGDLVPDYGWTQKIYNETEGVWTQEHYREDVDLFGEVFIGRAPVGNRYEVSYFVFKTLEYEEIRDHDPFVEKILLIGGRLRPDEWGSDDCEMVRAEIPYDKYQNNKTTRVYDKRIFDPPLPPFCIPYSNLALRMSLNNNNHLIFNMDHGEWNRILSYRNLPRYVRLDVYRLINKKPFFWYSGSCLTGKFDDKDCLAEFLTVKTKRGAFAVIMDTDYSNNRKIINDEKTLEQWFYYLMFTGEEVPIPEIGRAHQLSRNMASGVISSSKYSSQWERVNVYSRNLFGDPTVSIKIPEENHAPEPLDPEHDIMHDFICGNSITGYWYNFKVRTTDPDGDKIQYRFLRTFSENTTLITLWRGKYNSGEWANIILWLPPSTYEVRVMARDEFFKLNTSWSDPEDNITATFDSNIQTDSSTVILGEEVQFSGQASGGNEPYTSWYYNFGDGNYGQQQSPIHTYNTLDNYTVTLNVNDSENISSNVSKVISVVLLNADFEISPGTAISTLQETFDFNDKSKGYYDIVNWSWDFGDGNKSYNRNTSHTYSSYGEYNVSLTVTDNESNNDTCYQMIYIDSVPPSISSVSNNFDIVGYGCNVIISVNTSDISCGIKTVKVNITYPDSSYGNFTMNNTVGSIYEYVFSDCWQLGEYSYIVWVVDKADNCDCASAGSFVVSRIFGYNKVADSNQTINNTITGSVFRVNEKCVADNISVYLDPGNASSDYHYTCVIYHHNDSVLVGVSEEKNITGGKGWQTFNFSVPKPVLLNDTEYVIGCWSNNSSVRMYYDDGDGIEEYYDDGNCTLQGHYFEGFYGYTPELMNFDHEDRKYSIYCCYSPDNTSPEITNVSDNPDTVGFGFNVTITADVTDTQSGVDIVKVNVTYPGSSMGSNCSFDMIYVGNDTYKYVFNDTWLKGQYSYLIWAVDHMNNSNSTSVYSFNVSGQATISVHTMKDEYGNNEIVNLTDPPGYPPILGYELLDDGKVLHIWNRFDSYYFDTNSGIQLTNHYDEYWSHNVLMLGYYNNDVWNLIYRTDELSGFNKVIDCENETYINATLWKDLTYGGYDFRLAVRYHLGAFDNELTVIPYIKNIDDEDIPWVLGFAWEINDIRVDMTTVGDYIEINGTKFDLNEALDLTFSNMTYPVYCWDNITNESFVCDYVPIPFFYIREDMPGGRSESLYLRWDESLKYKVQVKSRDGEYNAPVTLGIKIGTLNSGQEKYTHIFWHDASEVVYYFDSYDDAPQGEAWEIDPSFMVDGNISFYARASVDSDVELCDNNTCDGADLGSISKVEIRCYGYYYYLDSQADIILRPVFSGKDGDNHVSVTSTSGAWSQWFDITNDNNAPGTWNWYHVRDLECDVEAKKDPYGPPFFTLFCSKVEVRVTYIVNPVISNPYPPNGSTDVPTTPVLNITVNDEDGDLMNITWLSNSSGSWQVFGTNTSVGNGTYHQKMVNASVNEQWWFWKVNVSDGTSYNVSDVFSFFTGYESKIVNIGSTSIKGYLLIQIHYYNSSNSTWVVADDTINETSPRTIHWDDPGGTPGQHIFALDAIFNGNVNTNYLISNFGTGTYRVYACFRNPDGDVLVCDDESLMEDTYQFSVSGS